MSHEQIQGQRLTIYCTELDRHDGHPLHEWLVARALDHDMGGATVQGARCGFGRHRRIHHQHLLAISDDLPVMVQIIDTQTRIDAYLHAVADALAGYTFIRENVRWHRPEPTHGDSD